MSEETKDLSCSECGSVYTLSYQVSDVSYEPDMCPFCGAMIDEDDSDLEESEED